ncbi:MAG TPA: hypothetical protein DFS52_00125 [Myxococcales bacterium]|jgi:hypothetical protein|nr:hypothetical protein [Myxococcales bacterium]
MLKDIGVVDSSVVILLGVPMTGKESADYDRRFQRASERMQELWEEGIRFVIPAPVITELSRDGPGLQLLQRVLARMSGWRIHAFDQECAKVAAQMLYPALRARPLGESRLAMKYDAMIAAVAHQLEAKYMLTDNRGDFATYLKLVSSNTELVNVSDPRTKGQLRFIDTARTKATEIQEFGVAAERKPEGE